MQIAIDLSTRTVMTWTGVAITSLGMTCRDRFLVDVRFISNGQFVELPEGAQGKLSIKAPRAWAGQARAFSLSWEKTIKPVVYRFFLRLDTIELIELFAGEPDSVGLEMEIEWVYNLGATPIRQTSKPIPVVISNDYIRETDGLPVLAIDLKATEGDATAGVSNERWMTPLRTNQAVLGLLATEPEAVAMTSNGRLMTPLRTKQTVMALRASEDAAGEGLSNDFLMTPLRTKQAIATFVGSGGGGGVGLVIDGGTL